MAVIDLAKALLACPSVTPDEAGTIAVLRGVLEPAGFAFEMEKTPNGTTNAWITHGSGAPYFVFAGHVDVVPPGRLEAWTTPPFEPTVREGKLFARGAADMKGSVACAAAAFARLAKEAPAHKGTLALLITSDEEGDGDEGTKRVVESLKARGITLDACIVGEPSCSKAFGDTIKNGRRGSLNGKIVVHGKAGHVAYPHLADNPIHASAAFFAELAARKWDRGNAYFDPTTFQISNLNAGVGAVNVVPGELTALFNLRFNTEWTVERLIEEIESTAKRHRLKADFTWKRSAEPFVTQPAAMTEILSQVVREVTGVTPTLSTGGGTSDARFICRITRETVELGPINATIHSVNENAGVDELEKLEVIYYRTAKAYLEKC